MYDLPYFKSDTGEQVTNFMMAHPFIMLTGVTQDYKPVVTHVPVVFEQRDNRIFLLGHIMRKTDHQEAFLQNNQVLAVFTGPHTYVSASWYKNPQQGSTWNYLTVHAKGTLTFLNDHALLNILSRTTAHFENNLQSPSLVEALPEEYVHRLMKAIVAFEIEVTEINHVFKLSQNRDEESYNNIIQQLSKGDANARAVSALMQQRVTL